MKKIISKIKWIIYKISHPFVRLYWRIFKPKTYGSKALIIFENQILLTKHINVSYWSLPGGKIDRGEDGESCIIRELKEELNLDIEKIDYKLGEFYSSKEGKKDTIFVFVLTIQSLVFDKQWELQDAKWFSIFDLPENMSPAALRRIKEFQENKKNIKSNW